MPETAIPQLADIRQVSDGWIKKYVLTYTLPDGSTYEYESASRKSIVPTAPNSKATRAASAPSRTPCASCRRRPTVSCCSSASSAIR